MTAEATDQRPYPSVSQDDMFWRIEDPGEFLSDILHQTVWGALRLPGRSLRRLRSIWVPGCGRRQALDLALRFPAATVTGTDVNKTALNLCMADAQSLGVTNLDLSCEDMCGHSGEYDYIVCTGVLHHLTSPHAGMQAIRKCLGEYGLAEVMILGHYRNGRTAAMKQALEHVCSSGSRCDDRTKRRLAEKMAWAPTCLDEHLTILTEQHAHTFSLDQFLEIATMGEWTVQQPVPSRIDGGWELRSPVDLSPASPGDNEFVQRVRAMCDFDRWVVAEMLLYDAAPPTWFYLTYRPSGRLTMVERARRFAQANWRPLQATATAYVRGLDGRLTARPPIAFPGTHPETPVREALARWDVRRSAAENLKDVLVRGEHDLSWLRDRLTSPAFPYLVEVGD